MRIKLKSINDVLRRINLLMVVGYGDGPKDYTTIEIITTKTWEKRISLAPQNVRS